MPGEVQREKIALPMRLLKIIHIKKDGIPIAKENNNKQQQEGMAKKHFIKKRGNDNRYFAFLSGAFQESFCNFVYYAGKK